MQVGKAWFVVFHAPTQQLSSVLEDTSLISGVGGECVQARSLDMGMVQSGQAFAPSLVRCYEEYVHGMRCAFYENRLGRRLQWFPGTLSLCSAGGEEYQKWIRIHYRLNSSAK